MFGISIPTRTATLYTSRGVITPFTTTTLAQAGRGTAAVLLLPAEQLALTPTRPSFMLRGSIEQRASAQHLATNTEFVEHEHRRRRSDGLDYSANNNRQARDNYRPDYRRRRPPSRSGRNNYRHPDTYRR